MQESASTSSSPGIAVIVNTWVVSDGYQGEFVKSIDRLFEHLRTLDGFLEGALLRGVNPTRFVSYVRMRSARDRQRLTDDPELGAFLREVEAVAHADLHSYDVLRAVGPPGSAADPLARGTSAAL
jgi:heme-degrading monooxygenase HmoA